MHGKFSELYCEIMNFFYTLCIKFTWSLIHFLQAPYFTAILILGSSWEYDIYSESTVSWNLSLQTRRIRRLRKKIHYANIVQTTLSITSRVIYNYECATPLPTWQNQKTTRSNFSVNYQVVLFLAYLENEYSWRHVKFIYNWSNVKKRQWSK